MLQYAKKVPGRFHDTLIEGLSPPFYSTVCRSLSASALDCARGASTPTRADSHSTAKSSNFTAGTITHSGPVTYPVGVKLSVFVAAGAATCVSYVHAPLVMGVVQRTFIPSESTSQSSVPGLACLKYASPYTMCTRDIGNNSSLSCICGCGYG